MDHITFEPAIAQRHAPLVQRGGAILATLGDTYRLRLTDEQAAPLPESTTTTITLARTAAKGDESRLTRLPALRGQKGLRFALTYADPTQDGATAALVACSAARHNGSAPIAADPESLSVLALAERLAQSDIPVLIGGPTGTGKEVLSRFIHDRSPRASGPFVAVNCAAMPEAMLEALLFGHTKGAFTGATASSEGFFRAADGGTLLLDEIAEMPIALQAKLLRALQEGEVVPIGSTQPIKIDVRIIAAANRDLPTEVAQGRFRADLFYRLNVFPLALKPLRDRLEDIAPLAFALAMRHTAPTRAMPWISDEALELLRCHSWPGNVRELENVIRRALLMADGIGGTVASEITPAHIQFDTTARLIDREPTSANNLGGNVIAFSAPQEEGERRLANIVQHSEAKAILEALETCGGSRIAAARQLGISERTLRYRLASMREAGLPVAASSGGRR